MQLDYEWQRNCNHRPGFHLRLNDDKERVSRRSEDMKLSFDCWKNIAYCRAALPGP